MESGSIDQFSTGGARRSYWRDYSLSYLVLQAGVVFHRGRGWSSTVPEGVVFHRSPGGGFSPSAG